MFIPNELFSVYVNQYRILRVHSHSQEREKQLLAPWCLSVPNEQLGCHWTDLIEIWYSSIVQNLLRKC
jgi:hypothetical protein